MPDHGQSGTQQSEADIGATMADFTQYNTLLIAHCEIDRDKAAGEQHAKLALADIPPLATGSIRKFHADQIDRQSSTVICKEQDPIGVYNGNHLSRQADGERVEGQQQTCQQWKEARE